MEVKWNSVMMNSLGPAIFVRCNKGSLIPGVNLWSEMHILPGKSVCYNRVFVNNGVRYNRVSQFFIITLIYSQTWAKGHLRIASLTTILSPTFPAVIIRYLKTTTCQQRPLFWDPMYDWWIDVTVKPGRFWKYQYFPNNLDSGVFIQSRTALNPWEYQ